MVDRFLPVEHRFVCLTDQPGAMPDGVEAIEVPPCPPNRFAWWSKLELFNPDRGLEGRVLYLDLDTLVVASLLPIVDYPSSFASAPHAGNFQPKDGRAIIKRYNSSVMIWDVDKTHVAFNDIWRRWRPEVAKTLWGDQDWLGKIYPTGSLMPVYWFPRLSEIVINDQWVAPLKARVILCKRPKNADAAQRWPWFKEMWK